MLKISSAKLTGNPDAAGWSQVHEFLPEDSEKLKIRGHFFAVIATGRIEEGVDRIEAGRELLARLHEEYFGKLEATPFNALKSAVQKVVDEFKTSWGEIELAAAAKLDDALYTVVYGGAEAAILRNGTFAKILVSERDSLASASGFPKDKDVFLLGTKQFFEGFAAGVLKAALQNELQTAMESLMPLVHSKPGNGNLGAVILKFSEESAFFSSSTSSEITSIASPKSTIPIIADMGNLFTGIKGKVSSVFQKPKFRPATNREIYIRGEETDLDSKGRKTTFTVGAILLALLILSIIFGLYQKKIKDQKMNYSEKLTQAQHEFDESITLKDLEPQRSKDLFSDSKNLVSEMTAQGIKDATLTDLQQKIENSEGDILGEYTIEPKIFLDLSIQSSGFKGDGLVASNGNLYVWDKNGKIIISTAIDTKKTQVVAGPDQLDGAIGLAAYEDRAFILTSDGFYEVGDTKKLMLTKDWDGEVIPSIYGGNLYLIGKDSKVIWRYPANGSSFSGKQRWLATSVNPDLSNTISVTIDGAIWILSSTGHISKYSLGSPQNFIVTGVSPDLTGMTSIFTDENEKYLYVLDRNNKRIVVLGKDGVFKAQYKADLISEATDLAVSEDQKKMIILTGSKLYSIDIKHL